MPQPSDNESIHLKKEDPTLVIGKREIEIGSTGKREFDFQGEVARMLEAAKRSPAKDDDGIRIDGVGFATEFLETLDAKDPIAALLAEAQAHAREERFDEALEVLARLLKLDAFHHEAVYLKAYCQSRQGDGPEHVRNALATLRALRGVRLQDSLMMRVQTLLSTLRDRRMPELLFHVVMHSGEPATLIPILQNEVDADPGFGLAQFLLAGELLTWCRLDDSLQVIDAAVSAVSQDDRPKLDSLRAAVIKKLLERSLDPARALYRLGKFSQALVAASKVEAHRDSRLFVTFESYLRELAGPTTGFWSGLFSRPAGRTPATVVPTGTGPALDELGFFLVQEDLTRTRKLVDTDTQTAAGTAEAERCALAAVDHAPWFPFIHFVCAQCIHARLLASMEGQAPDLEAVEESLQAAKRHLEFAATDKDISGVPDAMQFTNKLLAQIQDVKKARVAHEAEVKKLTSALEEFKSIMEFVGKGISDPAHFRAVSSRLEALKGKLPQLEQALKSKDCREALGQLKAAVTNHLGQLAKMRPDVEDGEKVEKHFKSFTSMMDHLNEHKISSFSEVQTARTFFTNLRKAIAGDQLSVRSPEARKALDHLADQVSKVLAMLKG